MNKRKYRFTDSQQADVLCYCRRCAREIYFTADGVHLGVHMLCADCVRQLQREDLSPGYREAAALLKVRLRELRIKIREQTDPDTLCKLKYYYLRCTQMYRECKDLAELTEHYYERSFYRDKHYTL